MRISDWSSDVCSSDLIILRQTPQRLVLLREPRISVFIRERTICEDFAPKRTIVEGRKVVRLINVFAVLNGIISAEDIPSIARDHVFIRKHAKEIPFKRRCHIGRDRIRITDSAEWQAFGAKWE